MNDQPRTSSTLLALLAIGVLAVGCVGSPVASTSTAPTVAFVPSIQWESESATSPELSDATGSGAAGDRPVLPVASNPVSNMSTEPGLEIKQMLVENNVSSATGKDAPDHLECALHNKSDHEMSGFGAYYQITDLTTGTKEGYHSKLEGFTIPPGDERVVHFDDTGGQDHYPDNEFSLYPSSMSQLQVDVTVSATGFAPQTASVKKDAGGEENPDE